MNQVFELCLLDGRATLRNVSTNAAVMLDSNESKAYDNAQHAVELAMHAIAALTGCMQGDAPDEKALADALRRSSVSLVVRGHFRECNVVALHLYARYALPYADMTSSHPDGGIRIDPILDAPDGFATYRFDSDMRPLDAVRTLVDRWLTESDRQPQAKEHAARNADDWHRLLAIGATVGSPVSVVITGVTGAGKSTFLNAILGRDILPHSTRICTAAVLRLCKAASPTDEGFEIDWRSIEEIDRNIKSLSAELNRAKSVLGRSANALKTRVGDANDDSNVSRISHLSAKIDSLKRALKYAKTAKRRQPLVDLRNYAENKPDSLAEAVNRIRVFLDHPLLSHVELIDAPGLRDGDDERQAQLIKAFEGDVAWLYLAPATTRDETCKYDWGHIKHLAHNDSGVLVLTKADALKTNGGQTYRDAMKGCSDEYAKFGWKRDVVWCSAFLPAALGAATGATPTDDLTDRFEESCLKNLLGLKGTEASRRIVEFVVNSRGHTELWRTVVDYALDASRIPLVLRQVGRTLYQDAIERRFTKGCSELKQAAQAAIDQAVKSRDRAEHAMRAHDIIRKKQLQLEALRLEVHSLTKDLATARSKCVKIFDKIDESERSTFSRFGNAADEQLSVLGDKFSHSFNEQSRGIWMRGDRDFPLVAKFEAPLGDAAHRLLEEHVLTAVKAVEAIKESGRGGPVELGDLLKNYVILEVDSVGDISDKERFFELASTTKERMWKSTQSRAARCVRGMTTGVGTRLKEIRDRVKSYQNRIVSDYEESITAQETVIVELEREIAENNPGQSREKAELLFKSLNEHLIAFESFLSEVERSAQLR